MARWQPVPVVGGAYTDDTKPWTSQDCVNRIPVMAEREGTRSPAMLRDLPGCSVFSVLGSNSPIRGLHDAEGRLFVVSAQTLYQIAVDGSATALGTIPGVGRVSIAHNQITNGNEIAIANGQSGYVYNTVTATLSQITDAGFPGAKRFDFCDGYMMFVEPLGRYWGHSDLAAATEYNTLDRSEAEAQPDRIVTGVVSHREWIVFGERSTEFYRNEGGATGTFQRVNGTEAEIGAAGEFAVAKLDNTVFVVGHDGVGYRINGYQFVRVTTHAIEQAWSRCDLSQAYCYVFDDRGHKVWYVTMTDGQTWGFDVATGEWHRRKSYGLDFWRMADLVRWNGVWIGGDYSNGYLYQLDWRLSNDAGEPLERSRTFAVLHDNQNRVAMNALELVYNTGIVESGGFVPEDLTISGDVPGGYVGDTIAGSYTSAGGIFAHTFAVSSGTFPPGLTLNSDGTYEGNYTTEGSYSWVVTVTDSVGNTATVADAAIVLAAEVLSYDDTYRYIVETGGPGNPNDYSSPNYDDSAWLTGPGGFGSPDSATIAGQTLGTTIAGLDGKIIWLRKTLTLTGREILIDVYHDDGAKLWFNGVLQVLTLVSTYHSQVTIPAGSVTGTNVIALKVIDCYEADGTPVGSPNIYASLIVTVQPE